MEKELTIASAKLKVFDAGNGKPVLFLHGSEGFRADDPYVGSLLTNFRVIAPSHPGFGSSSLPDWVDCPDDIAHIYLELLDVLELDKVDIVGCSVGGWIAAEIAAKVPERIRKLVLVGPVGVKVGSREQLDVPDVFAVSPQRLNELLYHDPAKMVRDPMTLPEDQRRATLQNRETLALLTWEPYMHNPKLKHRLHRVTSPTVFIRGASDGLTSAEYIKGYSALFPNFGKVHTIDAAGHIPHLERPEEFVRSVSSFLNG